MNLSAAKPRGGATKSEKKPQKELPPPSPTPAPEPEEVYEDEEEEEEEGMLSAGNLLNSFHGEGGYGGGEYYEY